MIIHYSSDIFHKLLNGKARSAHPRVSSSSSIHATNIRLEITTDIVMKTQARHSFLMSLLEQIFICFVGVKIRPIWVAERFASHICILKVFQWFGKVLMSFTWNKSSRDRDFRLLPRVLRYFEILGFVTEQNYQYITGVEGRPLKIHDQYPVCWDTALTILRTIYR